MLWHRRPWTHGNSLLSLTRAHSTRATHSTTRTDRLPPSALILSRSIQYESTDSHCIDVHTHCALYTTAKVVPGTSRPDPRFEQRSRRELDYLGTNPRSRCSLARYSNYATLRWPGKNKVRSSLERTKQVISRCANRRGDYLRCPLPLSLLQSNSAERESKSSSGR